ncbi:hypothetical protein FY557_15480 [Chryseobacterium sp. SN22]|uniref:hypothetical protein n=1 Tax=Chryseobacterium sp. SN22 TaxID=2606431 RepID=UPI0011EC709A|nr:hypothetical protein [Chryseobacterium sp. SN22]KAA0126833.1 hypothetical protein FY557_15480 [Chryseobacterium sp. SN22]
MATHYNFREIWSKKDADIPNVKEIKAKAERYRKIQLLKDIGNIVFLVVIALLVAGIWVRTHFIFFTTKLGIALMLMGLTFYIYLLYQKFNSLKKINPAATNQDYLSSMKKTEQHQIYMQTKGLSFYYISLSSGFAIYFYELTLKMSWTGVLWVYIATFFWIAVAWFIIRPRQIKKQKEKISAVIRSLEKLEKSFEE